MKQKLLCKVALAIDDFSNWLHTVSATFAACVAIVQFLGVHCSSMSISHLACYRYNEAKTPVQVALAIR